MPSIFGITVLSLAGNSEPLGQKNEEITRPGVDGHAYRVFASRGEPYEMIAKIDCDSLAAATSKYADMKLIEGQLCTTVDDFGETVTNVMVQQVRQIQKFPIAGGVGGISSSKAAFLIVSFTCQRTEL